MSSTSNILVDAFILSRTIQDNLYDHSDNSNKEYFSPNTSVTPSPPPLPSMGNLTSYLRADVCATGVATFFAIWWAALWVVHIMAIVYTKYKLNRRGALSLRMKKNKNNNTQISNTTIDDENITPKCHRSVSQTCDVVRVQQQEYAGVSIIKPLCGADPNLHINLETFFNMDYPLYEILFCVHTPDDTAVPIVKTLLDKYKHVNARLFIGGENVGLNPKINNMMPAYRAAQYPFILISDAGILMNADTLTDMYAAMSDNVAVVTQMPFTYDQKGFAATLEKVFFGTMHARLYMSADLWSIVCSTGMSSLLRKSALDSVGGMQVFGKYLAEDYFFASTLVQRGWKCAVSSQPAMQNHVPEVGKFHERICRWGKLRQAMLPHTIILEPLQDCMLIGVIAAWALNWLLGWNSLIVFLVHILVWMLLDYVLLSIVQHTPLPFGKFEYVVCWLWREMSALPLTLRALLYPTIHWRTGDYRLDWGGEVQRATSRLKQPPTTATTSIVDTTIDEKSMLFDESTTTATTTTPSLCVATNIIQTTTPLMVS